MVKQKFIGLVILQLFFSSLLFAQKYRVDLPAAPTWNHGKEGESMAFTLAAYGDSSRIAAKYQIKQGKILGMEIDSLGNFSWTPAYHLVDRTEQKKMFQVIIEAVINEKNIISKNIDLVLSHQNRAVTVYELKTFYVRFSAKNTYSVDKQTVFDEDNDPVVFIPNLETFPEGLNLSSSGEISWEPSLTQFKKLKEKPIFIEFFAQDQPAKISTPIKLKIDATQQDLSPEINIIPKKEKYYIKENETVNLRFYLSDPNGEEDIEAFDFLSNNLNIDKKLLVKNSQNQYEFTWTPGYDFVQDPTDTLGIYLDFFVLDKAQKREVKRVNFNIKNTLNEQEVDKKNYGLYYSNMVKAWELLEQLKEKEEELKKDYKKARKGKKQRSVVNASLGATTGLSGVIAKGKPDTQRMLSSIGGTTVLTISTLEATEVIGKSMKDLIDRLNYVIEKKNELQTKGDIFARDFSLKSSRRTVDFIKRTDDFLNTMNLKGLVALELSASWESKNKITESKIQKSFKDFSPF
jgi:hypothetical protein